MEETAWRVRGALPADDAEIGRILWEAFGRKMRPFLPDRGAENAALLADLFATGALRRESTRVVAAAEAPVGVSPVGVCLLRLPGVPYGSAWRMAGVALRHAEPWRAPWTLLGLMMLDEPSHAAVATVTLLAVAREARGRGAGGALLRAAEAEARARGLSRLALHVVEGNPARRLYERHGFRSLRTHQIPRFFVRLFGYTRFDYMEKPIR